MKPVAAFKYIRSKNARYGAAEQYLSSRHDEFTVKSTLGENGRIIPCDTPDNGLTVNRVEDVVKAVPGFLTVSDMPLPFFHR